MTIPLPTPIADYFAADARKDAAAVAACFTDDAVVIDERNTHRGREAIARWKADSETKFSYTVEPFAIEEADGRTVVTGHLEGDFPGSPVDLRYRFALEGGKIAALEIAP